MGAQQDPHQIVQLLGPWSEGRGPLYARLAHAFEHVIRTGELPAQTRLPAERWLARRLGVSRSTVVAAYARLHEGEWVTSRQGSGTQVSTFSPQRSLCLRRQQLYPLARGPVMDSYLSDHLEAIDLSAGAPAWPTGFAAEEGALLPHQISASLAQYGYVRKDCPSCARRLPSTTRELACAPDRNTSW
jgi:DNA-binding transcriptional MocR family regulator